jgi:hypothetical protein
MTAEVDSEVDKAVGIVFRSSDTSMYVFLVYPSDQTYKISYRLDDNWVKIVNSTTSAAINKNGTNQITVLGKGTEYTVYINGNEVNKFSDDTIKSGKVGFAAEIFSANEHATFHFDNFLLLAP